MGRAFVVVPPFGALVGIDEEFDFPAQDAPAASRNACFSEAGASIVRFVEIGAIETHAFATIHATGRFVLIIGAVVGILLPSTEAHKP